MSRGQVEGYVSNLFRSALRGVYKSESYICRELGDLHDRTPSIRAEVLVFNHPTGPSSVVSFKNKSLLALSGTIPIWVSRVQYNIPVRIWIPPKYPSTFPLVYVVPTMEMGLKSRHSVMEERGYVNRLQYIKNWKGGESGLVELVAILSSVFGGDPPVYSVARKQPPPSYNQALSGVGPSGSGVEPPMTEEEQDVKNITVKRVQEQLEMINGQMKKEVEDLSKEEHELEERTNSIVKLVSLMEDELNTTGNEIDVLREECSELEMRVEEEKKVEEPDVDVIFEDKLPMSSLQLSLHAEDSTLSDVFYFLYKGLCQGSVTPNEYVKLVRDTARNQFFTRARLMQVRSQKK